MTGCCSSSCAAIEKKFGEARARRELAKYLRKGAGPTTRLLRDGLTAAGPVETVLDVGAGVGALTFELLERGVRRAVGVDASAACVAAAAGEARRRRRGDQADWIHGDFVAVADRLASADAVTLDRVVCCYPRYEPLLAAAASRARRSLAISYPRDAWFVRLVLAAENAARALSSDEFRTFVHPPPRMEELIRSHGFERASRRETWIWTADVYVKADS